MRLPRLEEVQVPEHIDGHRALDTRRGESVDRPVPARLRASWERSERYGIPIDAVEPVFAGTDAPESLFHECGDAVLTDLYRTLTSEPVGMMLTDADGIVLTRVSGDRTLLRALDDVHLAPGFGYSEREVGTNGLGLALADLAPTLVRADQHYSHSLTGFTCAAAPVVNPTTNRLEGAVNLTTWSNTSSDLLLTLARSAAGTIGASMLARGSDGHRPARSRRTLFHVDHGASVRWADLGTDWNDATAAIRTSLTSGSVVAVAGEPGSGRATAAAAAARLAFPHHRILMAAVPEPDGLDSWFELWSFEAGRQDTVVVLRDADAMPAYVADRLRALTLAGESMPTILTIENLADVPAAFATSVTSVVSLPPLRDRPDDVLPLLQHVARSVRGREVVTTASAERALRQYDWPGNASQLVSVATHAVSRSDTVDVGALPSEILAGPTHRLSTIEAFERGEIVRVLSSGHPTMARAASLLGMSRATLYRKISYYKIDTGSR